MFFPPQTECRRAERAWKPPGEDDGATRWKDAGPLNHCLEEHFPTHLGCRSISVSEKFTFLVLELSCIFGFIFAA